MLRAVEPESYIRDVLGSHRLERKTLRNASGVCSCGEADYNGWTVSTPYCQALHEKHVAQELTAAITDKFYL